MPSAIRFPSGRAAVAAPAQSGDRRHALAWLAAFLLLSSVLAAAEIRSEALTLNAVSQPLQAASAIPPELVVTSRSDRASSGAYGFDRD